MQMQHGVLLLKRGKITAIHTVSRHVFKAAAHVLLTSNNNTSLAHSRVLDPKKNLSNDLALGVYFAHHLTVVALLGFSG